MTGQLIWTPTLIDEIANGNYNGSLREDRIGVMLHFDVSGPDGGAVQWFKDITLESGLDFVHETGATGALLFPEIMASGAALFDYDNDGDLDIYLTNGARAVDRSRADSTNKLYRRAPERRFAYATA